MITGQLGSVRQGRNNLLVVLLQLGQYIDFFTAGMESNSSRCLQGDEGKCEHRLHLRSSVCGNEVSAVVYMVSTEFSP